MRMRMRTSMRLGGPLGLALALGLGATGALADTKQDLTKALITLIDDSDTSTLRAPKFVFSNDDPYFAPKTLSDVKPQVGAMDQWSEKEVVAEATDRKSAWIAADLGGGNFACAIEKCPKNMPKPDASHHALGLAEKVGRNWQWVAWHIAPFVDAKTQVSVAEYGIMPTALPREIAGAEDVVKVFESTIDDPKAFAASISSRKDVVLYGSAHAERVVGGAAVRAKLGAWKLAFEVRDGVVAGTTTSKTAAFVAANVDARPQARPKDKPMPYRLLLIYEKTGASWQVVAAHFSVVT